jgi:hypothetical protein
MAKMTAMVLVVICGSASLFWSASLPGNAQGRQPAKNEVRKAPVRHLRGIRAEGFGGKPTKITTAKEFARRFGEQAAAKAGSQVDFAKEKVLLVTWTGSSSSYLTFAVKKGPGQVKVVAAVKTPSPALADHRPRGGLIVMPKGASWEYGKFKGV